MPADQEGRLAACDPDDQRTHAEVAVHDPELARLDIDPLDQGPLLAVGILLEDQVEDQPAGRLIDRQRPARQAGRGGGPQGRDAMLGAGQDVAIEDPDRMALDRLGREAPAGRDELACPRGRAADDRLGDRQLHAVELAVEGRERGHARELSPQEGGAGRGPVAAGDIEHDLDEVGQGQFAGILARGGLVEEFVQRRAVEDPVQCDAGHDRGRGTGDKGVEDGRQDQRCLLGRRIDSSVTKEVTLGDLRMFTGVILKNPAYKGTAAFGKTRSGEFKPQRLRPQRGRPEQPRRPVSRADTSPEDRILIEVPGLVSEDLFGAVQAQLEENRQRRRDRPGGGRYLLQGLVVCKRCGYGCYGKSTGRASTEGPGRVPYAYYRCTGSDAYRFGGQRLCWNKQVRTDMLDAAVWDDVRQLLSEPERVRAEYERRLQGEEAGPSREVDQVNKLINNVKKMISRLIDAYGDGLLDKSEFEPRISAARERLAKLETECRQRIG